MSVGFTSIPSRFAATYGGVGAPDVNVGVGDGLACLVVHNLDGKRHLDTPLAVGDVLADLLALDVYQPVNT